MLNISYTAGATDEFLEGRQSARFDLALKANRTLGLGSRFANAYLAELDDIAAAKKSQETA